jgi:hypothetical protein
MFFFKGSAFVGTCLSQKVTPMQKPHGAGAYVLPIIIVPPLESIVNINIDVAL